MYYNNTSFIRGCINIVRYLFGQISEKEQYLHKIRYNIQQLAALTVKETNLDYLRGISLQPLTHPKVKNLTKIYIEGLYTGIDEELKRATGYIDVSLDCFYEGKEQPTDLLEIIKRHYFSFLISINLLNIEAYGRKYSSNMKIVETCELLKKKLGKSMSTYGLRIDQNDQRTPEEIDSNLQEGIDYLLSFRQEEIHNDLKPYLNQIN